MGDFVTVEDFWEKIDSGLRDAGRGCGLLGFDSAIELLQEGAEEENPELMYLWAEFLLWGSYTSEPRGYGGSSILDIMPNDEEVRRAVDWMEGHDLLYQPDEDDCVWDAPDAYQWYVRSALAGYVPAICWLAWCAKRGIFTKPDAEKSRKWIAWSRKYLPVSDLLHEKLGRFEEYAEYLCDAAFDADLDEDIAMDQGRPYTGPDWRDLARYSVDPYVMGCMMGSPKCALPRELYFGEYGYSDTWVRRHMCVEKRMWQIWCALNGIGVNEANPELLREWMADINCAMNRLGWNMKLDEETSALLEELNEEVLRR